MALAGGEKTEIIVKYTQSLLHSQKDCGRKGILPLQSLLTVRVPTKGTKKKKQRLGEGGFLHPQDYISKEWLSRP